MLSTQHGCALSLLLALLLQIAAGAEVILTQPPLDWAAFESWMEDARRRQLHTAARLLVGFPLLSSAANVTFWAALCGAGGNCQVRTGRLQPWMMVCTACSRPLMLLCLCMSAGGTAVLFRNPSFIAPHTLKEAQLGVNMTRLCCSSGACTHFQQCQQLQQQFAAAEDADKQQQQQQQQQQAGKRSQPGPSSFAQQWNAQLLQRLQATAGVSGLHVMPITANSKRMALDMARQGAFASSAWPLAGPSNSSNSGTA
jgi:hypothetical protein